MFLISVLSLVVSTISVSIAIWAVLEAQASRRESIPHPFHQRKGSACVHLHYPLDMALKYGIESVSCSNPYELRRLDTLTIEQAADFPAHASRGSMLTYAPAATDINVGVSPYCRVITIRCRLLANPSLWVDHSIAI